MNPKQEHVDIPPLWFATVEGPLGLKGGCFFLRCVSVCLCVCLCVCVSVRELHLGYWSDHVQILYTCPQDPRDGIPEMKI